MVSEIRKIYKHYEDEAKKTSLSPKSTMMDQFIRKLEIEKITNLLEEIVGTKKQKVLEIGCGNGYTLKQIRKKFNCKFIGTDVNKEMIKTAKLRKLKNVDFKVDDITKTKFDKQSFDVIFTNRCLINLGDWNFQKRALKNIFSLLKPHGHLIMIEAFSEGLTELNKARKTLGLEPIKPAWHNHYFNSREFKNFIKTKFNDYFTNSSNIQIDSFLSSYYFGSRILYPALIENKRKLEYNNKFIEFFSFMPNYGNYGPLQCCALIKK